METETTTITMADYAELKNKELALEKALELITALEKRIDRDTEAYYKLLNGLVDIRDWPITAEPTTDSSVRIHDRAILALQEAKAGRKP